MLKLVILGEWFLIMLETWSQGRTATCYTLCMFSNNVINLESRSNCNVLYMVFGFS